MRPSTFSLSQSYGPQDAPGSPIRAVRTISLARQASSVDSLSSSPSSAVHSPNKGHLFSLASGNFAGVFGRKSRGSSFFNPASPHALHAEHRPSLLSTIRALPSDDEDLSREGSNEAPSLEGRQQDAAQQRPTTFGIQQPLTVLAGAG
ncbi:hypothetical protein WJX74_010193 [Apatococcus lobatus]|uniref:Uncharacterized protein n=1 Tax=Apatococcus lobatus TaxID=904363 RepID=A0AAW1QTZ9_9CHLO